MMLSLVEICHLETSSFHLPIVEMFITLDDVSSMLHLPINGKLLDYSIITRLDALDMIVTYLGANTSDVQKEMDDTIGCHARFVFLEELYINHLVAPVEVDGGDA